MPDKHQQPTSSTNRSIIGINQNCVSYLNFLPPTPDYKVVVAFHVVDLSVLHLYFVLDPEFSPSTSMQMWIHQRIRYDYVLELVPVLVVVSLAYPSR